MESLNQNQGTQPENTDFDPQQRLEDLKGLPQQMKRVQLEEYKQELEEQKEGVSSTILSIYYKSRLNLDMTKEEIADEIATAKEKYHLTDKQVSLFETATDELLRQRSRIKEIEEEGRSPEELFEDIYEFTPRGGVVVEYRPTGIVIKLEDPRDFELAFKAGVQSEAAGEDYKWSGAASVSCPRDKVPAEWKYTNLVIIARAGQDEGVLEHEEQHKYYSFFRAMKESGFQSFTNAGEKLSNFVEAIREEKENLSSEEIIKRATEANIKAYMFAFDSQLKDEIQAYYKQGAYPDKIVEILGPNYFDKFVQGLRVVPETRDLLQKIGLRADDDTDQKIASFGKELLAQRTKQLAKAISLLEAKGYTKDEITARLFAEPASDWLASARRAIERKTR